MSINKKNLFRRTILIALGALFAFLAIMVLVDGISEGTRGEWPGRLLMMLFFVGMSCLLFYGIPRGSLFWSRCLISQIILYIVFACFYFLWLILATSGVVS